MKTKIAVMSRPFEDVRDIEFKLFTSLVLTGVFLFLLLAGGGIAKAEGSRADGFKVKQAVSVVELFTSQGCSSCPPADAVFESYVKRPDVVALSYSVDYWDYLGWRDTFGRAENSERQRNYARVRGDGAVYTPQVVVNGLTHMNGASQSRIDSNINSLRQKLTSNAAELSLNEAGGRVIVSARYNGPDYKGDVILWLVRVQDVGKVAIRRGENQGRSIKYHNIVLAVDQVASLVGDKVEVALDRQKLMPASGKHSVLLLQVGAAGPVLGAVELR